MNIQAQFQIPETFWQKSDSIVGPALASDFHSIGQQDTRLAIEKFIIENSGTNTKMMDAGCNTGVQGFRLMESGYSGNYLGVDSNLKALAHAMQNLVGTRSAFALADLENIPYPDKYFDLVLNKDVIEHSKSYEGIIRELARTTKKHLIISFFIKLNNIEDKIVLEPGGYYHNSYEASRFLSFLTLLGMGTPEILFENETDQVLLFTREDG